MSAFLRILAFWFALFCAAAQAQQQAWEINARDGGTVEYDFATGTATLTNGAIVRYGNIVLTADAATVNKDTGEAVANGRVRVQSDDLVWAGENVSYNFKTRRIQTSEFRAGRAPFFVGGRDVTGNLTNKTYTATNGFITLDDYETPFLKIRAQRLKIIPGEKIEAHNATLCAGNVPLFFLPFYTQRLDANGPGFLVTPGYKSRFGGFLLGSYGWRVGQTLNARLHLDYRTKRGVGAGPDLDFHLGQWGDAMLRYYYLHDEEPEPASNLQPFDANRQRLDFHWLATPFTNTTFKSQIAYASDEGVRREFFEGEYRNNIQPNTYLEARHFWDNFSVSALAQPRVNDFFNSVERLPEVKLTGFRQQLGATPLFYESETSAGYYRRRFSETNGPTGLDFEAGRADTHQQLLLPINLFGWLNVTPRVGGRFSYYGQSSGPGAVWQEEDRAVFNTGAEVSTKLSRLWAGTRSELLDLDGVRHLVEPNANYAFVPNPSTPPARLPQFDYDLPNLHLRPVDVPEYNAIDALDSRNVLRLGVRNRLQTKRDGRLEEFFYWDVFADWKLDRDNGQETWEDLWSDLRFKPRTWMTLESVNRLDLRDGHMNLAFEAVTLQPARSWSWRGAYFYLRDDFAPTATAWGAGEESLVSTFYFRLNENWGARLSHFFDVRNSELREQAYSIYRDFRSWTGALTFRARKNAGNKDEIVVGFNISLKALPQYDLGEDTVTRNVLMNY